MRSDSDTDDEDNPKKQVPKWAEGTQLRTALLKQCYMGPDVDKIFYPIEDPDLSVMFNLQCLLGLSATVVQLQTSLEIPLFSI